MKKAKQCTPFHVGHFCFFAFTSNAIKDTSVSLSLCAFDSIETEFSYKVSSVAHVASEVANRHSDRLSTGHLGQNGLMFRRWGRTGVNYQMLMVLEAIDSHLVTIFLVYYLSGTVLSLGYNGLYPHLHLLQSKEEGN